ncbi:hypothetical protein EJ05DRAFT_290002 [Pseudovirgaria hyperparasitica]|uniref:Uncharacterized protein n=1 Tax=Pseudovirgaria hyperparasitica TaxID=470096 RepID=A0A6A6WEK8_9PEZI|nr:uncharacterized protein EJ05DRAFT_290002 [Pseudovirgaria hyperparasitica]KAF2760589.1 hypothetical protein EJ05DRAFT_290002 [Pseudovirgaria hyperparasitica]
MLYYEFLTPSHFLSPNFHFLGFTKLLKIQSQLISHTHTRLSLERTNLNTMGDNSDSAKESLPVRSGQTDSVHLSPDPYLSSDSGIPTPSMLTPNTRAEAEFAFTSNALKQTDSAAPSTAPPEDTDSPMLAAPRSTRRPLAPPRSGSSNYIAALAASRTVPEGFDASNAQSYSPVTPNESQSVDKTKISGVLKEDTNTRYGDQQDMKRERQKALLAKIPGHGYDSTQETASK